MHDPHADDRSLPTTSPSWRWSAPEAIRARVSLLLLWLLGVPIPVLLLIALFRH